MRMPLRLIIGLVLACDVLLAIGYLLTYACGLKHLDRFVDLGGEANIPAWYSSMKWLLCAVAFGIFALRNIERRIGRSWVLLLLPVLFVGMSADEVAQIHEALGWRCDALLEGGDRSLSMFHVTGAWMLVLGVPMVLFLILLAAAIRSYFDRAGRAWKILWLGMVVMLAGALGVETLSNFLAEGSTMAVVETAAEEFLEMLGTTIVLWSGVDVLAAHEFSLQLGAAGNVPAAAGSELRIKRSEPAPMHVAG